MQPVTVYQSPSHQSSRKGARKTLLGVGVAVVLVSIVMIGLDAGVTFMVFNLSEIGFPILSFAFSGIWGGILCAIAGGLGICAAQAKKNHGLAIATIVMGVFSAIQVFCVLCIQGAAAAICSFLCPGDIGSLHSAGAVMAAVNFILTIVLSAFGCQVMGTRQRTTGGIVIANVPAPYGGPGYQPPTYPAAATTFTTTS